jgi:hypothetical protein
MYSKLVQSIFFTAKISFMKIFPFIMALPLLIFFMPVKSQEVMPKGFEKGSITLLNGSVVSGFFKTDMRKSAITFAPENGSKKITYDADGLLSADIGTEKYLCIKGEFFLQLCDGELSFLKKISDASSKPVYAGAEAIFLIRTEGKPGDYFILNKQSSQLNLLSHKNLADVAEKNFLQCTAAIDKAKQTGNDIAQMKDAVILFNNRNR